MNRHPRPEDSSDASITISQQSQIDLKTLGLGGRVSFSHLRCAYRELAVLEHPDHSKRPDATQRFQSLCDAYERLKLDDSVFEDLTDRPPLVIDKKRERDFIYGFGSTVVEPRVMTEASVFMLNEFEPLRIVIPVALGFYFQVHDIVIGSQSQFTYAPMQIPAQLFAEDENLNLHFDVAKPGELIVLKIENRSWVSREFQAAVVGKCKRHPDVLPEQMKRGSHAT